jgi:hypothetical protein
MLRDERGAPAHHFIDKQGALAFDRGDLLERGGDSRFLAVEFSKTDHGFFLWLDLRAARRPSVRPSTDAFGSFLAVVVEQG